MSLADAPVTLQVSRAAIVSTPWPPMTESHVNLGWPDAPDEVCVGAEPHAVRSDASATKTANAPMRWRWMFPM